MKLEIQSTKKGQARRDAFVVFAARTEQKKPDFTLVPEALRAAAEKGAPAEAGSDGCVYSVPLGAGAGAERLWVFGMGTKTTVSPRKARGILRNAVRTLQKAGERSAVLDVPFRVERMDEAEARTFLLRSAGSSAYAFTTYKSDPEKTSLKELAIAAASGVFTGASAGELAGDLAEARALVAASRLVRDVGNAPSNDMVPRHFADVARREAKSRGIAVKVLDRKAIEKERMGGLLAVNRGSAEEPRFVVLDYRGGRKGEKPVALVGKGVTFDSGGISIKPADRMGDMKWDMLGAATVLGAVTAAADLELPVNIVGLMPLTENMPSGSAYKPGDIVRFRNGKTAEIDNTDAEGRVILADALDYASELEPAAIVDYATLTGAALVALGLEAAIVFSDDDALAAALVSAGERTDERLWRLPMWDDYKENIRSDWADFKNTGGRYGGAINGAMFLKEFVAAKVPWAHLDIAPTAYYERDHAGYPVGATAFGVALTLRWLKDRAAAKSKKP